MKYKLLFLILSIFFCFVIGSAMRDRIKRPQGLVSFSTIYLVNERSEILLLRRMGTGFADGLYALPGGKIESGETPREAAQREAQEEIGILIEDLRFVHVMSRQGPETEFYIFVFKAILGQEMPFNAEPTKCDDIQWFPMIQLPENLIPAHRHAIELISNNVFYSEHGWSE